MAFESPGRQGPNPCVILSELLNLSEPELLLSMPTTGLLGGKNKSVI